MHTPTNPAPSAQRPSLVRDEKGATAIEYGLIAAFVALAIVATLPSIKRNLSSVFGNVNTELARAARG